MSTQLQDLDIFTVLGVDGTSEEKEQFLDEMQATVWDSITQQHLEEKMSDEQLTEIENIIADENVSDEDKKARLSEKLNQLIPNVEQVIMDTTNELKADLLQERLSGMTTRFQEDTEVSAKLKTAQEKYDAKSYQECVEILNAIE